MVQRADLTALLRMLIGADGPSTWVCNVPWPVHNAIAEYRDELATTCTLGLANELEVVPCPGLGMKVEGLNAAIDELAFSGELIREDLGFYCCWSVQPSVLPEYRRHMMRADPAEAAIVYRAAQRWLALASISLKNLRAAGVSSGSMSRSVIPMRRQPMVPTLR